MTINVNCFIPEDCNESFFYDKHGNITGIWRQGQEGVYHIDNLSFQYNGNQIKKITDHANSQNSYSVKEYQDLADEQTEFFYDANGNLITDLDRDIVTIRYNLLNLPDTIQFKNGRQIINRYDATGQKLSTMYVTPIYPLSAPLTAGATISTDNSSFRRYGTLYNANVEYTLAYNGNRTIARIHNAEGYALPSNILFYHRKDHLGSIRSLWSTNYNYDDRYYPSGLPWSNDTGYDVGPYKYNGKEFIETHGLDEYDSQARWYYPAIMRTTTPDPHAENYYNISPYAWCGNNPVNRVDLDGRDWYEYKKLGEIEYSWNWHDGSTYKHSLGKDKDGNEKFETLQGFKAVVVFDGSKDEKLGKGDNLFGEGAVLADVTVYGPKGADDIQSYQGFTMSSDFNLFGAIADGDYTVNYRNPGKQGALSSNWAVNNTNAVDCLDDKNPSPIKPYSSTQKNGIYIHRSNNDGRAGKFYDAKGNLTGAVSTGCLLIAPSRAGKNIGWNEFNNQLKGVSSFYLRLNR